MAARRRTGAARNLAAGAEITRTGEDARPPSRRRFQPNVEPGGTSIAAEPSLGRAAHVEAPPAPAAAAVAELFERHGGRILAFCRGRLRDAGDAEDAAQTTFLLAQRALARGVVPRSELTWLLTIAQNVCLNRHRDARRVRAWEHAREPEELDRLAVASDPAPLDVEALKEAVAGLPEPQRRAILLREWQGWSYAEIERELGLGKAAVETLIFRARRALARQLEGRLRALDGLSLASALKGLLGGGGAAAAKLGVAAAVVAVAGAGVVHQVRDEPARPERARDVPATEAPAPVPAAEAPPRARPSAGALGAAGSPATSPAAAAGVTSSPRPEAVPAAPTGDASVPPPPPTPREEPAAAPEAPAGSAPPAAPAAQPASTGVGALGEAVAAAESPVGALQDPVAAVEQTADETAAAVDETVAAVEVAAGTVTAGAPAALPPPLGLQP